MYKRKQIRLFIFEFVSINCDEKNKQKFTDIVYSIFY